MLQCAASLGELGFHNTICPRAPFYSPCLVNFYLREMALFYEFHADTKGLVSGLPPRNNLSPVVRATQYDTGLYAVSCRSVFP